MEEINIVFITDNNFAILTGTAIQSLYENRNKEITYNINIICNDVSEDNIQIFKKFTKSKFKIKLTFVNGEKYENLKLENWHVSTTALFKFDLPNIFENYDKILFVDGDILIKDDLVDLYSTKLDSYYAGVCADLGAFTFPSHFNKRLKIKHKNYFNSGMMLLNLKKLREDKIPEKLIEYRKKGINFYMDQDALNVVFKENVKYLSLVNNFLITAWRDFPKSELISKFDLPNYENMISYLDNAKIVHFCSSDKPSKYEDVPLADEWFRYYKKSPFNGKLAPRTMLKKIRPNHVYFSKPELKTPETEKLSNPLISVIIPVYNAKRFLRGTLETVTSQSLENIEIICVDDGSNDGSVETLKKLAQNDSRFVIIEQKNQYAGVARNNGIKHATGDYIVFLDSDDKLEKGALEKLYEKAVKDDSDVVLCKAYYLDDITKKVTREFFCLIDSYLPAKQPFSASDVSDKLFNLAGGNPWAKCFKREFILKHNVEFLPIKRSEDFYFVYLALSKAERISAVREPLFFYRINNSTSLESTKDEAPLLFWDATITFKDKLVKDGIYEKFEKTFLNNALDRVAYNLRMVKRHESLEKIFNLVKEIGKDIFDFDNKEESYYYSKKNYDIVKNFYKMVDLVQYYNEILQENVKLKNQLSKAQEVLAKSKKPSKKSTKKNENENKKLKRPSKLSTKLYHAKKRGFKWVLIRTFKGKKAGDKYITDHNLW